MKRHWSSRRYARSPVYRDKEHYFTSTKQSSKRECKSHAFSKINVRSSPQKFQVGVFGSKALSSKNFRSRSPLQTNSPFKSLEKDERSKILSYKKEKKHKEYISHNVQSKKSYKSLEQKNPKYLKLDFPSMNKSSETNDMHKFKKKNYKLDADLRTESKSKTHLSDEFFQLSKFGCKNLSEKMPMSSSSTKTKQFYDITKKLNKPKTLKDFKNTASHKTEEHSFDFEDNLNYEKNIKKSHKEVNIKYLKKIETRLDSQTEENNKCCDSVASNSSLNDFSSINKQDRFSSYSNISNDSVNDKISTNAFMFPKSRQSDLNARYSRKDGSLNEPQMSCSWVGEYLDEESDTFETDSNDLIIHRFNASQARAEDNWSVKQKNYSISDKLHKGNAAYDSFVESKNFESIKQTTYFEYLKNSLHLASTKDLMECNTPPGQKNKPIDQNKSLQRRKNDEQSNEEFNKTFSLSTSSALQHDDTSFEDFDDEFYEKKLIKRELDNINQKNTRNIKEVLQYPRPSNIVPPTCDKSELQLQYNNQSNDYAVKNVIKDRKPSFSNDKLFAVDHRMLNEVSRKTSNIDDEYIHDTLTKSEHYYDDVLKSTEKPVKKNDSDTINSFKGAWKAATNTSIKLKYTEPKFYHETFHNNQIPTSFEKDKKKQEDGDKRISILRNTCNDESPSSFDKRKVQYSNQASSTLPEPINQRIVIQEIYDNKNFSSFEDDSIIDHSRMVEMVKTVPPLGSVKTVSKEKDFWEKEFVDWFSKHILPTQAFKLYMEQICVQITPSRLATLPFEFLQHFQKKNPNALNCLPDNPKDAQILYSFVHKYRQSNHYSQTSNDETAFKDFFKSSQSDFTKKVKSSKSKMDTPIFDSEKVPQLYDNKRKFELVRSISSVTTTLNMPPINVTTFERSSFSGVTSINTEPINVTMPFSEETSCFSQLSTNNSLLGINKSKCVNPKWNAEVQEFIGRTKSAHSRPAYVEYLEKTANKGNFGKSLNKDFTKKKAKSTRSPSIEGRSYFSEDARLRHHNSFKRSLSPSLPPKISTKCTKPEPHLYKSKKIGSLSKERSRKVPSTVQSSNEKVSSGKIKKSVQTLKNKPKLIVNVSSTSPTRKVLSSNSPKEDKTFLTSNSDLPFKEEKLQSLFATSRLETIASESLVFDEAKMNLLVSDCGLQFKQIIKNEARKAINFFYAFEKYNQKKIKDFALKVCRNCKQSQSWSPKEAVYFIKQLYDENKRESFQDDLKKKLEKRGRNWKLISWETNLQFQKEVFNVCALKLNKQQKYFEQNKQCVIDIIEECELVYPQYCGDCQNLIKMWVWKNQAEQYQLKPLDKISHSLLHVWETSNPEDKDLYLAKLFRYPPFNSTSRRCIDVISILNLKCGLSKKSSISHVVSWWIKSYFKWKYYKVKEPEVTPDLDLIDSDDVVVIDETHSEDSDVLAGDELLQDHGMSEYTEDDSGAPTILLY